MYFKIGISAVAAFAALALTGAAWAKNGNPRPARRDATTILVKFDRPAATDAAVRALGDRIIGQVGKFHLVKIDAGATVDERLTAYRARADVLYAESNYIVNADLSQPNDPSYGQQWGMSKINAVAGWSIYPGGYSSSGGVVIAVVDSGIESTHGDLAGRVLVGSGANCTSGICVQGSSEDDYGHGTHVAGIAGASTNNGLGGAGVAFISGLLPVKVLGPTGSGTDASVSAGILWAAQHGARVANLSLGSYGYSQTLCDAVATAQNSYGVLIVAAAGNDSTSTPLYPAACQGAIGIAATDSSDESPYWSNWGSPNVFLSAPGDAIYSTWPGNSYATKTGTSMATPFVSGLAALLFSEHTTRTPKNVKQIIAATADKVGTGFGSTYGADPYGICGCGWAPYFGYGRINVAGALAVDPPAPPPPMARGVAVFRPSSGVWYIRGVEVTAWGQQDDSPVSADYNGDGKADVTVFRPSTGYWYIRGVDVVPWGQQDDIAVPADYNGDRKADIAVFRPSTGLWYVRGVQVSPWGEQGDVPVPADYNGDGEADIAVFRPSTGYWYIRGVQVNAWGEPGDVPVPADYNGDGKADVAVFRPSTGYWYIRGVDVTQWGQQDDIAVPADYDRDGKAEIAVFRPSTGYWYIRGIQAMAWGEAGDVPFCMCTR